MHWLENPTLVLSGDAHGFEFFDKEKGEYTDDVGDAVPPCAILLFFANLRNASPDLDDSSSRDRDSDVLKKINSYYELFNDCDAHTYLHMVYDALAEVMPDFMRKTLLLDTAIELKSKKRMPAQSTVKRSLTQNLSGITMLASAYAEMLRIAINDNHSTPMIIAMDTFFGHDNIKYDVKPGYKNGELLFCDMYIVDSSRAILKLELISAYRDKTNIKQCENCGKYFIPAIRSDEIYCDNIFKNKRTCKQLGYENKLQADGILREYRKIYKTQNARKRRNSHIQNIDKRFKQWADYAKVQRDKCQSEEITVDEMKALISSSTWLKGETDNG